jgi:hypothetical protein
MSCEEKKQKEEQQEKTGCGCTSAGGSGDSVGSEDSRKTSEQMGTCCAPGKFPYCAEMMKKMAACKQGKQQPEE